MVHISGFLQIYPGCFDLARDLQKPLSKLKLELSPFLFVYVPVAQDANKKNNIK